MAKSIKNLRKEWTTKSKSSAEQQRVVEQLVLVARSRSDESAKATGLLIELMHLARHASDRTRLINALGSTRHIVAIPALHAELSHIDVHIRTAALEAIGEAGFPFGGALINQWVANIDLDVESEAVLAAALTNLAQTGHPAVETVAERLWSAGRISPNVLHTALADAGCPRYLAEAREHLRDPETALSAALHLFAARSPDLPDDLQGLRESGDLRLVHVADHFEDITLKEPRGAMQDLVASDQNRDAIGRKARRLRAISSRDLCTSFKTLVEGTSQDQLDHAIERVLLVGAPDLQRTALLASAQSSARGLRRFLFRVYIDSPELDEFLMQLMEESEDDQLVVQSIRTWATVYGPERLWDLTPLCQGGGEKREVEFARAIQNAFRDRKRADGSHSLDESTAVLVEQTLACLVDSEFQEVRRVVCYAIGHIGLLNLKPMLLSALSDSCSRVRQAAASALSTLPEPNPGIFWEHFMEESDPDVQYRLTVGLLRGLEHDTISEDALRSAVEACKQSRGDIQIVGIRLLGHMQDPDSLEELLSTAESDCHARALEAITALGVRGDESVVAKLIDQANHADPGRVLRATEALTEFADQKAREALAKIASRGSDLNVRRLALVSLAERPASKERMDLLVAEPEDPLVFEVLIAKAASLGRKMDAKQIDRKLEQRFPGFAPSTLEDRCPDALQALRTAEFLSGETLPSGLDASPPIVFWVKGFELWAREISKPLVRNLIKQRYKLKGCSNWEDLMQETNGWDAPAECWKYLYEILQRALRTREWLLSSIAATLVVSSGRVCGRLDLMEIHAGLSTFQSGRLAGRLMQLYRLRNSFTHARAVDQEEVDTITSLVNEIGCDLVIWIRSARS